MALSDDGSLLGLESRVASGHQAGPSDVRRAKGVDRARRGTARPKDQCNASQSWLDCSSNITGRALTATAEPWFSFNIREDTLAGIDIGTALTLTASGNARPIPAQVTELRRLGDFATSRAARAVGDHDLNTFAVRADPCGPVDGLEPGMTVWISETQFATR